MIHRYDMYIQIEKTAFFVHKIIILSITGMERMD